MTISKIILFTMSVELEVVQTSNINKEISIPEKKTNF